MSRDPKYWGRTYSLKHTPDERLEWHRFEQNVYRLTGEDRGRTRRWLEVVDQRLFDGYETPFEVFDLAVEAIVARVAPEDFPKAETRPCHTCGHHPHTGGRCYGSVSKRPDVETYDQDGCRCTEYSPDDGTGRWDLQGRRIP